VFHPVVLLDRKVIQRNIRDITARKNAELVSSRLAAIVESSDDAIIGKDMNSIITSWNRGAEELFGYAAGEMVGTSVMRLIPADRQDEERRIAAYAPPRSATGIWQRRKVPPSPPKAAFELVPHSPLRAHKPECSAARK
jgi:PAS domain-containing protein